MQFPVSDLKVIRIDLLEAPNEVDELIRPSSGHVDVNVPRPKERQTALGYVAASSDRKRLEFLAVQRQGADAAIRNQGAAEEIQVDNLRLVLGNVEQNVVVDVCHRSQRKCAKLGEVVEE